MTKRQAKKEIRSLVEKFEREKAAGNIYDYNEEEAKKGFIEPLLEALGWATRKRSEVSLEHRASGGRVDYALKIEGIPKIFVEAKPPKKELKDPKLIGQAINYGYNRGDISWVLLTDFEEFRLFDVTVKPTARNLERGLKLDLTYEQYLTEFDDLWVLSRDGVAKGEIDHLLLTKPKERIQVNRAFLEDLKRWRERLAKDIYKHNPAISAELLREATQRLLDRVIFIRSCEDRKIVAERQLRDLVSERREDIGFGFMPILNGIFDRYNRAFNSDLFSPDEELRRLKIDFRTLKEIILQTYDPYLFDVLPVEILGNIYEQYLGYTIRLTDKRVKYDLKPEVRKAGGVYYTPEYVVDYIVENTVGRLLRELKPRQAQKIRILDPACGSGSFLIRAYKELEDYYQRLKIEKYERRRKAREKAFRHQVPVPFSRDEEVAEGRRLTLPEKRQIVLNHIFGVDIDEQAVEVTRLSLMLKMLEGEMGMGPGRAMLPMLDHNIQCGNSLISGGVLELKKFFGDDWPKTKPFDWDERFKKIMDDRGFDVVVGNPPYGDLLNDREKEFLRAVGFTAGGRNNDVFRFFVERSLGVLGESGLVGMILPNAYLTGSKYRNFRDCVVRNAQIVSLVNFGTMKVFPQGVFNSILILRKVRDTKRRDSSKIHFIWDVKEQTLLGGEYSERTVSQSLFVGNDWVPLDSLTAKLMSSSSCIPLAALCDSKDAGINYQRIGVGWMSRTKSKLSERILYEGKRQHKFDIPYIKGTDIHRYQLRQEFLNKRWLRHNYQSFIGEDEVVAFNVEFFTAPEKIVTRQTADSVIGTIDTGQLYTGRSLHCTTLREDSVVSLKYVLGVLNSKLITHIYQQITREKGRAQAQVKLNKLRRLPIRKIDFDSPVERKMHDDLVALVDIMLDLNKKVQKARGSRKALLQRQIEKTDREIDQLVYRLYGLTKEEIKIIEFSG